MPPARCSLAELLRQGEGQHLEFKSRLSDAERLARTLGAFANSGGGTLLVGVADDGTIVGCAADAEIEATLRSASQVHLDPPVECTVSYEDCTGLTVARIEVPASNHPHRLYFAPKERAVYVRSGASDRLASPQVIRMLGEPRAPLPIAAGRWVRVEAYFETRTSLTLAEYMTLVNTSKRTARDELHRLVQAGHLRIHTAGSREEYTLA